MDIYIIDNHGVVDIIDVYESVVWNMQYFGPNDFEIVLPCTDANVDRITAGTMLVRGTDATPELFKNVMRVEGIKIDFDADKGWKMTITGGGLKKIVGQRIVWEQMNLTGNVETAIRSVITDNLISPASNARRITGLELGDVKGFTDTFDIQLFGENIAEWLEETCKTYGYGWDVYKKRAGGYLFELYQGENRTFNQTENTPVIFSPTYDNLVNSSYTYEKAEFKNAAKVGGEGEGTSQRTATVGTATGLDRFEEYIDGSSVSSNGEIITAEQYTAMLEDYGKEQLTGTNFTETFEGQVINNGMYTFGVDYFLGDVVQIDNSFVSATSRIIEMIYAEDTNGSTLTPTFTDWEVL